MIYSRSTEYAIRALIPLAQAEEGKYVMAKTLAEQENIPSHFLAKILQQLARKGVLRSSKGPMGGFSLRMPADKIRIFDIVDALDGLQPYHLCISGLGECPEEQKCPMHDGWVSLHEAILDYLKENTVADLVVALDQKRKKLARKNARKSAKGSTAKAAKETRVNGRNGKR
ncbi:MAG: Rrf2 family transcriptional regulator [Acidobacteria bacterium]|nr:Rrf2 family transcriptional regulator [Acidobacteriota bacterium]